jgi:hypothetical protein
MATLSPPLSLAHLTVLDTTPPELITVAAAAGFRTVGIRLTATPSVGVPPYDMLHEGPVLRETLQRLADTGVSVLDTEFLRFEPEQPVGIPEGFLEISARLGARNVLVMSAEPDEMRTLDRFGDLCDRAARYGLGVGLEFAIYTGVRTLAHAAQVHPRIQVGDAERDVVVQMPAGPHERPLALAHVGRQGHVAERRTPPRRRACGASRRGRAPGRSDPARAGPGTWPRSPARATRGPRTPTRGGGAGTRAARRADPRGRGARG